MPSFWAGHSVISSAAGQLVRGRLLPTRPQGQDAQLGPKGRPGIETSAAASLPSLAGLRQDELGAVQCDTYGHPVSLKSFLRALEGGCGPGYTSLDLLPCLPHQVVA